MHEADAIENERQLEMGGDADPLWVAVHIDCGGTLRIVEDDWKCEECGTSFHDDHCADLVHEREDRAAREAASQTWKTDPEGSARRLAEARVGIRSRLLGKRETRAAERG